MCDLAILEMEAGNFDLAINSLEQSVMVGDSEATYQLSRIYYHGIGVVKDRNKSEFLLRKIDGDDRARMLLADLLCTERGSEGYLESCSIYSELASRGDAVAIYKLALVQQALGKNDIASANFLAVINNSSAGEYLKINAKKNLSDMESSDGL